MMVWWWPTPPDDGLVPDHPPVDLTEYIVPGSLRLGPNINRRPYRPHPRLLCTRWRRVGRWTWRAGLMRGEWWIGVRHDLPMAAWTVGVFGLVIHVGRW